MRANASAAVGLVLSCALVAAGCSASSADVLPAAAAAAERTRTAERLAALFDYVASDYGAAVSGGEIVSQFEYDEQLALVADMRRFAAELGAPFGARLDELEAEIRALAPPEKVARACADLRRETVERFDVAVAPALPPDLGRARALYAERCAECHGLDGRADTPRARTLEPTPADLLDPERMAGVTPYRAYCAITYGIEGTSMAGHSALPDRDRWSLAFYSVGMRHGAAGAAAAQERARAGPPPRVPRLGLATLASETDEGLDRLLARAIPDPAERAREIARLRAEAPFAAEAGEGPIPLARRLIAQARDAMREGRPGSAERADRLVLDAYLHGIEAVEAIVAARDPALVADLEDGVARLRAAIRSGSQAEAEGRALRLLALLDRAEGEGDRSGFGAAMLAFAGGLLVLREGIEAALVVAALLAVVRRMGAGARATRAVHGGWTSALAAGVLTFVLARTAIHGLFDQREMIEAVVSLLATAVLVLTSFWLISKADARRWLAYLKARAAGSVAGGRVFGLASLAFLAVYREAFETVLFFKALAGSDAARFPPILAGAAAAALPLAVVVYAIVRLERRLPIGAFFGVSGAALLGLAVVLLGHGVAALEQAGVVAPRPIEFPRVSWLGIYPDAVTLGAQAALLGALALGTAAWFLVRRTRGGGPPGPPGPAAQV